MDDAPQTHYLNAEFDLALRPRARRSERPGIVRQVRELSAQALLGAQAGDAALVRAEIPQELPDHLAACGLPVPRLLVHPRIDPQSRLAPFGWSAEAIELNRLHHRPAEHPPLSTIRRVNSRSFALELEADLSPGGPPGTILEGREDFEAFLSRAPSASEWVIKAEHGNSGLANRRLRLPRLSDADRRFVNGLFAEDDRVVIEPWLLRERDWCVVFDAPFVGKRLRVHETYYTRDGAMIGALFEPAGPQDARRPDELATMAERVASRLVVEGYSGPVCMDAIGWRDGQRFRLRPLVDLNCRLSMSDGAHRLWRQLAAERTLYYRFFNRRKLGLPDDLPQAVAALGEHGYDRSRRGGILFVSPFRFGVEAESWRPAKLAVIFVADGRTQVFELEQWFRSRFES